MLFICQHTFCQLEKTAARKKPQLVETDMPDRESSPKTHDSVPLPITFLRQICGSVKSTNAHFAYLRGWRGPFAEQPLSINLPGAGSGQRVTKLDLFGHHVRRQLFRTVPL